MSKNIELFRAKRLDNNQWVYWTSLGKFTEPQHGKLISGNIGTTDWTYELLTHPGTQSRSVGIQDKNGKEIFGGDIIRHYNDPRTPDRYALGIIEWDQKHLRWSNHNLFEDKHYMVGAQSVYEVVGNIVDHRITPDLEVIERQNAPAVATTEKKRTHDPRTSRTSLDCGGRR